MQAPQSCTKAVMMQAAQYCNKVVMMQAVQTKKNTASFPTYLTV